MSFWHVTFSPVPEQGGCDVSRFYLPWIIYLCARLWLSYPNEVTVNVPLVLVRWQPKDINSVVVVVSKWSEWKYCRCITATVFYKARGEAGGILLLMWFITTTTFLLSRSAIRKEQLFESGFGQTSVCFPQCSGVEFSRPVSFAGSCMYYTVQNNCIVPVRNSMGQRWKRHKHHSCKSL